MQSILADIVCNLITKLLHSLEKEQTATFLTRWYWKRKADKARAAIYGIQEWAEKLPMIEQPEQLPFCGITEEQAKEMLEWAEAIRKSHLPPELMEAVFCSLSVYSDIDKTLSSRQNDGGDGHTVP